MPLGDAQEYAGWDAWVAADGTLRIQTPEGNIIRTTKSLKGRPGKDGKDGERGPPGKDGRDGVDGRDGPAGPAGIRGEAGAAGKDGAPGKDGKDGRDGRDGADGLPGTDGLPGSPGPPGDDGDIGPIPRHELDPEHEPYRIRFELERDMPTGKTVRWGEWIDLKRLLPKFMPRERGGGGGTQKWEIIKVVQQFFGSSGGGGGGGLKLYISGTQPPHDEDYIWLDNQNGASNCYDWKVHKKDG